MLGRNAILHHLAKGTIQIDPYRESHLGPNSYDLSLGDWVCRMHPGDAIPRKVEFTNPIDWAKLWSPPEKSIDGMLVLRPYELVLSHTVERVGCYENVVGEMASRSTIMRMGVAVCLDAGLGDVGFDSKWTMEIFNHTAHYLHIPIGSRIAQMKFHEVDDAGISYEGKGGTYGLGKWEPEDMLPRSSI